MDVSNDLSTNNPMVAIILGLLSVGGTVMGLVVKKALSDSAAITKMKHEAILEKIEKVRAEITLDLAYLKGDFRVLKTEIQAALSALQNERKDLTIRSDAALNAVKNVVQRGENRFLEFQRELKEVRVIVDRITRKTGG